MWIDTCMFNGYLFLIGVGVGISFCVLKLCEWNELFLGNFWGPPNLSSSCDNNYTDVKHVSFKNIILGRYKMIKNPLRIHAKSLSDALAPSKKNCLRRLYPATVRGSHIYSRSAHCLPDFCQKGWSKGFCRLHKLAHQQGMIRNMWQPFLKYTFELRSHSRHVSHHNKHIRSVKM